MKTIRYIVVLFALSTTLSGCSLFRGTEYIIYDYYGAASSVQLPEGQRVNIPSVKGYYSDESILIAPNISSDAITIIIKNTAAETIKVLWDDAVFIDQKGLSHRIIHIGTKFDEKEKAQVPSVIAPSSRIEETLYPSDYINWTYGAWGQSGWQKQSIYNIYQPYATLQDAQMEIDEVEPIKLLLPIESNGIKKEYTFRFDGKNAKIKEQEWNKTYLIPIIGVAAAVTVTGAVYSIKNNNDHE